jgi:CubicO group peptidase (beta-lactamase class C family)
MAARAPSGDGVMKGYVAPGFEPVRDAFDAGLASEIGASFAAIRDGEIVVDVWGGFADRARTRSWERDTIAPVFSTTKGVSAIVMAWLYDQGLIDYDAAVSTLWPAFGAQGKDKLTIAQALAHQAGVPGFPDPIDPALWLDPHACAEAIAALAPLWPPGTASGYHPLTWGYIAGEIAQRASDRSLGAILREEICVPLGIDFFIGTPASEHARVAEIKKPSKPGEFGEITPEKRAAFFTKWANVARDEVRWREIEIPSGNGHGNARSVARLYEVFATGGVIDGAQVLSLRAFDALTTQRSFEQDRVLPFRIDWRTGIMGNANGNYGPNPEACGHSGSGGSCGFGDPIAGVSVGYVMNQQSPYLMGDPRALKLIDALYACL